ncbi:YczE/YyaS/YitT family protein [uncultured Flavonifractor sp.]|uniref:YczE/YyaS/YitT family protein n=1 Tax=uncultured Flavonifractor sp. TaxID=1193534 RepID=UPI002612EE41|nr:DUF6198 family protein [uncultured Flavonifractor sp.]
MSKTELVKRYLFFVVGLFVNSMGIALITRANLGTSPISSTPYVLSLWHPALSLGMFTLFFSLFLIVLQLIVLGRRFPKHFWLQIPVSFLLSAFIDLSMSIFFFVDPQFYPLQILSLLIGCLVLGFGVFMEVAANVVMLPGECTVKAITMRWHTDFGKTKICVDVTMVVVAAVLGFVLCGTLTGIREGSVISALLVGLIARTVGKLIGEPIQRLLSDKKVPSACV